MGDYVYNSTRQHRHHFLRRYIMPGDSIFTGGWLGRIYMLWLLTVGIINFCLFMYYSPSPSLFLRG